MSLPNEVYPWRKASHIITNILEATTITGSTQISGSTILASTLTVPTLNTTNIIATNVTGSSTVSGSDIRGTTATIVNIKGTNITGSGTVSGSDIRGTTATIPTVNSVYVNATNITGSTLVSGSTIAGTLGKFSASVISGSALTYQGYTAIEGYVTSNAVISGSVMVWDTVIDNRVSGSTGDLTVAPIGVAAGTFAKDAVVTIITSGVTPKMCIASG